MRTLRRIFFYATLTATVVVVALIGSVVLFKDKIIRQFIEEANKQLNTPVRIGKLDVSVFDQFPRLSIVCTDVYIEDSHAGLYPLFTARQVSFGMNPVEVWQGVYNINGLSITDSETNLKLDKRGENNYTVIRKQPGGGGGAVSFALRNVSLTGTRVHYVDLRLNQNMTFVSDEMIASIETTDDVYDIDVDGNLTTERLEIEGNSFLEGKSFAVVSNLSYNDAERSLRINPSSLKMKNAAFDVSGDYSWKDRNLINIETTGKNTDIQTLISLLGEAVSGKLEKYQSDGDVYFSSRLKGEISRNVKPSLSIEFGFTNATLFHPDYESRIEEAGVTGSFFIGDLFNSRKASLVLKDIKGVLNNENFEANLVVNNFRDPEVICNFKGKVDAPSVLSFYPLTGIRDATGSLVVDLSFEGKISLLKNKATAQRVSTLGTVGLEGINFLYGRTRIPLRDLKGNLQFSNNDLALSNVSGSLGNSDFLLNGFFKNIITYILFEDQPIGIETDLKARFLDLDELFALSFGDDSTTASQEYNFAISRNVNLNFNCDVGALQYKRFRGSGLKGDLLVKNQMAVSRNCSMQTMGGRLNLSGIVDAQNTRAIDVVTNATLDGMYVDSVFHVFENFNQDFLEDRHLKGQASADVSLEMTLNQHLRLFPETLIADISATLKNGQLNNFDPMKKLSRYLDDEGLSSLRFSELKNDIHIENKTVFIPQMEVRSNVSDLVISGTHTFDQQISYRLVTPLKKKRLQDPEAQLAIEDDPQGGPKLFLKIVGTTSDYRILYDTESVKKKIVSDLKKEVRELKDAFKTKGKQKQKELELEKDDYFDWNEN